MRKYLWVIILATPKKSRRWIAFALLLIVALISLLVVFELTGILKTSPTPEIIVMDTVSWNMTKALDLVSIDEKVESLYEDDSGVVSANFTIHIGQYYYHTSQAPHDLLHFNVYCSANTSLGFIYSVNINFSRTDSNSVVYPMNEEYFIEKNNLNIEKFDGKATPTSEAQVTAKATGRPNATFLRLTVEWHFLKEDRIANHWATITLETTIFNGTAYVKTVMPIQLEVLSSWARAHHLTSYRIVTEEKARKQTMCLS